jgi:hypothetical protein
MPGSHSQQINEIMEVLVLIKPMSVLDVGVGFGKYGVLVRERLDLWEGAGKDLAEYKKWQRRVDGIEAYEGYLTPLHQFIYNHIYLGDALKVVPTISFKYDLILLIDVIEHFSLADGLKLLRELKRIGRNVLVSTPKHAGRQEALYGNDYEQHISQWQKKDFVPFVPKIFIPNQYSLICLLGEDVDLAAAFFKKKKKQIFKQKLKSGLKILFRRQ